MPRCSPFQRPEGLKIKVTTGVAASAVSVPHRRELGGIFQTSQAKRSRRPTVAALTVNPNASMPSRATPRAFTVELPFTDRFVGSVEFVYQLMLRTNHSHYAVLKPGYLGKSYQLASAVTRVVEKPLTCSETHCERRMSK